MIKLAISALLALLRRAELPDIAKMEEYYD